jgi:hypothetical protein
MASQPTSSRNAPKASGVPSSSRRRDAGRINTKDEDLIGDTVVERTYPSATGL